MILPLGIKCSYDRDFDDYLTASGIFLVPLAAKMRVEVGVYDTIQRRSYRIVLHAVESAEIDDSHRNIGDLFVTPSGAREAPPSSSHEYLIALRDHLNAILPREEH